MLFVDRWCGVCCLLVGVCWLALGVWWLSLNVACSLFVWLRCAVIVVGSLLYLVCCLSFYRVMRVLLVVRFMQVVVCSVLLVDWRFLIVALLLLIRCALFLAR